MASGPGDDDLEDGHEGPLRSEDGEARGGKLNGHHGFTLDDLQRRIAKERAAREAKLAPAPGQGGATRGMGIGFRMATDFSAAILVGALLGWAFDQWLKTSPWGLIICFLLGFCAAILNVVRLAQQQQNGQRGTANATDPSASASEPRLVPSSEEGKI